MIRKWYEVTCDYEECKAAIGHYIADTIKEAAEQAKRDGAIVRYVVGRRQPHVFCNEECLEKWAKEHGYDPALNKCKNERKVENENCLR